MKITSFTVFGGRVLHGGLLQSVLQPASFKHFKARSREKNDPCDSRLHLARSICGWSSSLARSTNSIAVTFSSVRERLVCSCRPFGRYDFWKLIFHKVGYRHVWCGVILVTLYCKLTARSAIEQKLKIDQYIAKIWSMVSWFLPARRYASAGLCDSDVSVCLSARPSVRHTPVLWLAERKQDREMYTFW